MCTVPESWPVAVPETWVQLGQGPLNAGSNSDSLNGTVRCSRETLEVESQLSQDFRDFNLENI